MIGIYYPCVIYAIQFGGFIMNNQNKNQNSNQNRTQNNQNTA